MKYPLVIIIFIINFHLSFSQVGIGNTDPKSTLELSASSVSSPKNDDGILIPRINDFPSSDPGSDQDGMLVFLTGDGTSTKGIYFWDNDTSSWIMMIASNNVVEKIDDLSDGKSDSDGSNDGSSVFLGVNAGFIDDSSDNQNVGIGYRTLANNSTGSYNTAIGYQSLFVNSTGSWNTAVGNSSLNSNSTGGNNVAIGLGAMYLNTTADSNVAVGPLSLYSNTTGAENIAIGPQGLYSNTTGTNNIAIGFEALYNSDANVNIGIGGLALYNNTSGAGNIALGSSSLSSNITGNFNIAVGEGSLLSSNGDENTSLGFNALYSTSGSGNIAIGYLAGYNESGSNRLYIENSDNDENAALIYGEFDNDLLRVNAEFQIGVPTAGGYSFPTSAGTSNYVLQTDGIGTLTWADNNMLGTDNQTIDHFSLTGTTLNISLEDDSEANQTVNLSGLQDADWYESTLTPPNSINDNIFTNGNVGISETNPLTSLSVNGGVSIGNSTLVNLTSVTTHVVANKSMISLNNTSGSNWTLHLSNGLTTGQFLYIIGSSSMTNNVLILDSDSNIDVSTASLPIDANDVLTLLWDGSNWLQVNFSKN